MSANILDTMWIVFLETDDENLRLEFLFLSQKWLIIELKNQVRSQND